MRALICLLALLVLAGCAAKTKTPAQPSDAKASIAAYLDMDRPKAALALADELVATNPADYENHLTRNAVHLALRDYQAAMTDNENALAAFEAGQKAYPEKSRPVRLAGIHESFALTALIAATRAADPAERQRWQALFVQHAKLVRELDADTWRHLQGMLGRAPEVQEEKK